MLRFILRRTLWAIPVLLAGSFIMFAALHLTTDPVGAAIHHNVSSEALVKFKHDLGLDKSLLAQYWVFLSKFVRGDFGTSYTSQTAVWPPLRTALVNSLVLGAFAAIFYITVGVTIGVLSAVKQYSWFDHASTGLSFFGLAMPPTSSPKRRLKVQLVRRCEVSGWWMPGSKRKQSSRRLSR